MKILSILKETDFDAPVIPIVRDYAYYKKKFLAIRQARQLALTWIRKFSEKYKILQTTSKREDLYPDYHELFANHMDRWLYIPTEIYNTQSNEFWKAMAQKHEQKRTFYMTMLDDQQDAELRMLEFKSIDDAL